MFNWPLNAFHIYIYIYIGFILNEILVLGRLDSPNITADVFRDLLHFIRGSFQVFWATWILE